MPLIQGFLTSLLLDRYGRLPFSRHVLTDIVSLWLASLFLLMVQIEGMICLLMASPLILLVSMMGSGFARAVSSAFGDRSGPAAVSLAVVLPFLYLADSVGPRTDVRRFSSEVIIDASPERIWPYLSNLDSVDSSGYWMFRAGIAHPLRTETDAPRVGSERRCVLSTGVMREEVTEFVPGKRLAFKVLETPASMREMNPFGEVGAAHLTGYFECLSGSFELQALPDGRTRVVGVSVYQHRFRPRMYWGWWTDQIVREIQSSVLHEVKRRAER